MTDGTLLIFSKVPRPGAVKRRLIPVLGKTGAAELYARLLKHTFGTASGSGFARIELWCSGNADAALRRLVHEHGIRIRRQTGRDLGERMAAALTAALAPSDFAVLIGCDCPALTGADLRQAATWLKAGAGAVLGPATDGGYYLIGLRRVVPALFVDMPWGTGAVLAETRVRLQFAGIPWRELPERPDIDRPEDLARLPHSLQGLPK